VALDLLNATSCEKLGSDPALAIGGSGLVYCALGDLQSARSTCAHGPDLWISQMPKPAREAPGYRIERALKFPDSRLRTT